MTPAPISNITGYHAHIYYRDAAERERAAILRETITERFPVELGRWRDMPVGPHEQPMFQVVFSTAVFAEFAPWLMLNRLGLTILIHPNTDNPRRDHLAHALWMGEILKIIRPEQLPETTDEAPGEPA
jgi:aromatic ring-cleaving dioxygenase